MNEVSQRIKMLRKNELKMSQDEFASKILMKRNSIAQIETGIRNASDRTIRTISQTYNVNEDWLRNGNEPIFKELSQEEEIASYLGTLINQEGKGFQKRFIRALSQLDDDGWDVIEKLIDNIVSNK